VTGRPPPPRPPPLFHVVLHEPEIPNNTGNIGRTCVATGCALHLIRPLGFQTSEKACRRAGLDYWPRLGVREHDSWDGYLASHPPARLWLFSTKPGRPLFEADLLAGDALVFGKETGGLPESILHEWPQRRLFFPMLPGERSLNLATAVCAAVYEGIRQLLARGEIMIDESGRLARPVPQYTGPRRS
jgi:tRNA (cytidine/uridine-2'-O-)-methyltransferase